jgi:NAD(P)-dependent dehydrogenase (short-subunit alcohol dehydrogenase family)
MKAPWLRKVAWFCALLSFPVWFGAFLIPPFLPLDLAEKAVAAGLLLGAGEALFWGAALVLGAELVNRFRTPKIRTGSSFLGRRVAVIGANGGLGEAIARALHREGAELVLVGRDASRLAVLSAELKSSSFLSDLSVQAQREAAGAAGPVDHVVVATGVDVRKPLQGHTDAEVEQQLDIALLGPISVVRAWLGQSRQSILLLGGFGDGQLALPYYTVDVSARAGLSGFVRSLNRELVLEGDDRRLLYFCPAPATTPAELPFAALWTRLGSPPVAPEAVADRVLQSLLSGHTTVVMGWGNRALVAAEHLSTSLVDLIIRYWLGPPLREALGGTPPSVRP